jgi:frataxin-like iron-binding protein CyaY
MAAPPPTRSPAMGSPATTEIRNATNLRTVVRNDPAAAEILATSTYSVIYHYNADLGKWEKQKQEGSLFIVRR